MQRVKSLAVENSGHWRSRRHWGIDWEEVPDDKVDKEMRDDPRLRIEPVTTEPVTTPTFTDAFTPVTPHIEPEPLTEEDLCDVEPEPTPAPARVVSTVDEFAPKHAPLPQRGKAEARAKRGR